MVTALWFELHGVPYAGIIWTFSVPMALIRKVRHRSMPLSQAVEQMASFRKGIPVCWKLADISNSFLHHTGKLSGPIFSGNKADLSCTGR